MEKKATGRYDCQWRQIGYDASIAFFVLNGGDGQEWSPGGKRDLATGIVVAISLPTVVFFFVFYFIFREFGDSHGWSPGRRRTAI